MPGRGPLCACGVCLKCKRRDCMRRLRRRRKTRAFNAPLAHKAGKLRRHAGDESTPAELRVEHAIMRERKQAEREEIKARLAAGRAAAARRAALRAESIAETLRTGREALIFGDPLPSALAEFQRPPHNKRRIPYAE